MSTSFTKVRKRFSRIFLVLFTKTIGPFARLLPYPVAVAAGGMLGSLSYHLLPRERKRALAHLALAFPDRGSSWIKRTARKTFVHLGKALMETVAITPRRMTAVVNTQGLENIQTALDRRKGIVYFTGHIGNWELMAGAVARSFPVSVVAAPLEPEPVNEMIVRLRNRMGVKTILRNRPGAAKELIRIFRENRILGILIDQDTDVEGAFVDFMGRPAWTPTAAAQMAIKFGAPVLFGYIQRTDDDRHTITIEGPLDLARTGNDEEDIRTNTAMFTKKIEEVIRRTPEQWVWMHRRWRRQP
ncbi:MAG: Lipid biosynthesis lauroyl acyltransferase [Nitrospirae bacterium]|nr:Lipid biosynthesis lauroyl acyltransferase [Nitrospirota bacterium]